MTPEELGAPTATNKDALFDWQFENAGKDTVSKFGGVKKLMENFGTDEKNVGSRRPHHP